MIRFLTKIALLFAAGLAPLVLGEKIAGAISKQLSGWAKPLKKSALDKLGAPFAARAKFKKGEIGLKSLERMATGRGLRGFRLSPEQRNVALLQAAHMQKQRLEGLPKEHLLGILGDKRKNGTAEQLAAARLLAGATLTNDDNLQEYLEAEESTGRWLAWGDSTLMPDVKGGQPDLLFTDAAWAANPDRSVGLAGSWMAGSAASFQKTERHAASKFCARLLLKAFHGDAKALPALKKIINRADLTHIAHAATDPSGGGKSFEMLNAEYNYSKLGGEWATTDFGGSALGKISFKEVARKYGGEKGQHIAFILDEAERMKREMPQLSNAALQTYLLQQVDAINNAVGGRPGGTPRDKLIDPQTGRPFRQGGQGQQGGGQP